MAEKAYISWVVFTLLMGWLFAASISTADAQFQRIGVHGVVIDTAKQPLRGVSVRLASVIDTLVTSTDNQGKFRFKDVIAREFILSFSILGHQILQRSYMIGDMYPVVHILPIVIYPEATLLREVQVNAIQPIIVKGDTIQYNLEAYQFRKNTLLETALKSLPDIHVLRDGTVIAHGKRVSRVKVDGKEFFGGDVLTATRNLHAEMIKSVQVIDQYSDASQATGFKTEEPEKIINIQFHDDKKRILFGQVTGGGGTVDRYLGSVGVYNLNHGQQLSLIASANNTNTSLFSYGSPSGEGARQRDLSDLTGMTDPIDGVNAIRSIGMSFSDSLSKNVEVYGKYSFTHKNNQTLTDQFLSSAFQNNVIENLETKEADSEQQAHNMSWDVKVNTGKKSYLKVSPNLTYTTSLSQSNSLKTLKSRYVFSEGEYSVDGRYDSPTLGTDIVYVQSFDNPRRKLVFDARVDFSRSERSELIGDYFVTIDSSYAQPRIDIYSFLQESSNLYSNRTGRFSSSYVEPLHKNGDLEFKYQLDFNAIQSSRDIWDVEQSMLIDSLGLDYKYRFNSHRYGLTYKGTMANKFMYTLGLALQPITLEGQAVLREIRTKYAHMNWIPSMSLKYQAQNGGMLSIDYSGINKQPTFAQIHPVRDLSNSQHIVIGNPDLGAEFANRLALRFFAPPTVNHYFDFQAEFNNIKNKIVAHRKTVPGTTVMETTFQNSDGYYDLRSRYSWDTRLSEDVLDMSLTGNADYIHNISYTNELRNVSEHFIFSQNAQIRYSMPDALDLEFNGNFLLNKTSSSLRTASSIQAHSLLFGMAGRAYLNDHWTLGFDVSRRTHNGYGSFIESNPTLFNAYLEFTFMSNDRALLRFQGMDIFNQSTGVTKEMYDSMDLSVRNNRLGQYFMVSLNIRFQKLPGSTNSPTRSRGV